MICRKQPAFLTGKPVKITNLLEIRLAIGQWHRIAELARHRRRTYSTITRYCVLRLARKCSLRWTARMRQAKDQVQAELKASREQHRHMLCLYGEDEKLIRIAALDLGITLTAFVRLALALYLPTLAVEKHSRRHVTETMLTWEGIRLLEQVQIFATNAATWPLLRELNCHRFAFETFW